VDLSGVRFLAGGTGAGKSKVARILAARHADPRQALENRLGRDALWDAEIRRQARAADPEVTTVDGQATPAGEIAGRFRLRPAAADHLAPGGGRAP
jgi:hypothetical protein